jgi:hypothetical protein
MLKSYYIHSHLCPYIRNAAARHADVVVLAAARHADVVVVVVVVAVAVVVVVPFSGLSTSEDR